MAGSKAGGAKCAATNKRKYGNDYYQRIGALGGSVRGAKKGFAIDKRNILEKLFRKPKTAKLAGRVGGHVSKRTKKAV